MFVQSLAPDFDKWCQKWFLRKFVKVIRKLYGNIIDLYLLKSVAGHLVLLCYLLLIQHQYWLNYSLYDWYCLILTDAIYLEIAVAFGFKGVVFLALWLFCLYFSLIKVGLKWIFFNVYLKLKYVTLKKFELYICWTLLNIIKNSAFAA